MYSARYLRLRNQVVFASHVGRPKHKRAMIGGALDGDVFLGKKVRADGLSCGKGALFARRCLALD